MFQSHIICIPNTVAYRQIYVPEKMSRVRSRFAQQKTVWGKEKRLVERKTQEAWHGAYKWVINKEMYVLVCVTMKPTCWWPNDAEFTADGQTDGLVQKKVLLDCFAVSCMRSYTCWYIACHKHSHSRWHWPWHFLRFWLHSPWRNEFPSFHIIPPYNLHNISTLSNRHLGPYPLWLWGFGLFQTRVSGLLFRAGGYSEYKFEGHLELQ